MRRVLFSAVVVAGLAWGCKRDEAAPAAEPSKGGAPPNAPAATGGTRHACTILVARKPGEASFAGEASGPDEQAVDAQAWQAACAKLPAADQAACRDDQKFSASVSGGSVVMNGVTTYNRKVVLAPKIETVSGKGESTESREAACRAATLDACAKAGGAGDCVTAGTHEKKGEMTESGGLR